MQKRRKILYVITKSVWGGAQKYVWQLASNLSREQFEPLVVSDGIGPLTEKLKDSGIRTFAVPAFQRDINPAKEVWALFSLLAIFLQERPGVIHLNSSKVGGIGAVAAFFYKILTWNFQVKIIFTAHGWGFNEDRPRWQKMIIYIMSWFASLFQNDVITINTLDFLQAQKFIPKKKLHLIFNGIEKIDFSPRQAARDFFAQKIKKEIIASTVVIGTIAELVKNKGIAYVIAAAAIIHADLKNVIFIVIGGGEDYQKLEQQIAELKLSDTIMLFGAIPEAKRYLRGMDIFALPSIKEGLPYVIMEAMAAGLPIVATNVGGIPDLIQDHVNGVLVSPKSIPELSHALEQLVENASLRQKFAEAQRSTISKFDIHRMVRETIEVYIAM